MVTIFATGGVVGIFLLREEHGDAATVGGDVVIVVIAGTYPILVCGGIKGGGAVDGFLYGSKLFVREQLAQGRAHVIEVRTIEIRVGIDVVGMGRRKVGVGG